MRCLTRLVPLGGLLAAAVLVLSATPTGATIVCSPGHTPPPGGGTGPYCKNVKPKAVTLSATHVGGKSAKLNGLAGAGVAGGDPTQFFFQYGTTTAYGKDTPTQILGSCPPGIRRRVRTAPPLPVRRCRPAFVGCCLARHTISGSSPRTPTARPRASTRASRRSSSLRSCASSSQGRWGADSAST